MMDWQRIVLIGGMVAIGILLLIRWNEFQEARQPDLQADTTSSTQIAPSEIPTDVAPADNQADAGTAAEEIPTPTEEPTAPAPAQTESSGHQSQLVSVKTDHLEVIIDTYGGDIVKAALPKHPVSQEKPNEPLVLLNRNQSQLYVAQSGLVGRDGTDLKTGERPVFSVEKTDYVMGEDQETLKVDLTYQQDEGVTITKRYTFKRGNNLIQMQYLVDNQSNEPWRAHLYGQIKRDDHEPSKNTPAIAMNSFLGVATTTDEQNYKKFDFEDIAEEPFNTTRTGGWVAFVQHYFISAWIPDQKSRVSYSFRKMRNRDIYLFGFTGPATEVAAGEQKTIDAEFYVGPKDVHRMEEIAPHLELTIDYGPLWFLCKPLFYFLHWLHSIVGNWGVAIILLTVSVKAAFFHLSAKGFKSMAKMRKFTPKMNELKERYGDNKQKLQEEMMKLYKKEGVNPLGGCLPMLVQIPVFIALYWVLMESVELRHAPFMLWIDDLSQKDPYFVLPLLYGATFFLQQKLQPAVGDPTQQKIMQMMPIVFTFFFLFFPAGLVLYWVVNGILSMLQQYVITRRIDKADAKS